MKLAMSTLNPYAASYIPLSKRESNDITDVAGWTTKASRGGNQMAWYGSAEDVSQSRRHDKAPSVSGASIMKSQSAVHFSGPSSENQKVVKNRVADDEELEMDLAYLQALYPGMCDDSLAAVCMANGGDLEASIDMLNQLESGIAMCHCRALFPKSTRQFGHRGYF